MEFVKIVRCKECVNWDITWSPIADYYDQEEYHYCPINDRNTESNFFCASGESVQADIEKANDIYWRMQNCYESDCFGEECQDCDYFVPEKEYQNALTILRSAGLIDEEGELI